MVGKASRLLAVVLRFVLIVKSRSRKQPAINGRTFRAYRILPGSDMNLCVWCFAANNSQLRFLSQDSVRDILHPASKQSQRGGAGENHVPFS
jgi:hypothetical protein